jgi:hypothetical protein
VVFTERIGPSPSKAPVHFLQWVQADVFNQAVRYFCRDAWTSARAEPQEIYQAFADARSRLQPEQQVHNQAEHEEAAASRLW